MNAKYNGMEDEARIKAYTPEVPCKTHPDAPHVDNSAHEAEDVHENVNNVNMSEKRVHKSDKSIHEPVAIVNAGMGGIEWFIEQLPDDTPLYTAPPKREWVGLTDKEWYMIWRHSTNLKNAIEEKLREKNHR